VVLVAQAFSLGAHTGKAGATKHFSELRRPQVSTA
jgi:hypothetical protein